MLGSMRIFALAVVLIQALCIGSVPFVLNDWFLTTPDAGGWACGAQTLADTGAFSDGHTAGLGYNFNICWAQDTYPGLQYLLAGLVKLSGVAADRLIPLILIGLLAGLAVTMWGVAWNMTRSHTVALLAGLATSLTPIVLRAQILTPQNLFGYWLIALMLLLIVHIIATKHYAWWLGVAALAGLLGYIHSLSFGIAGIVLAVWFYGWYLPNWKWRVAVLLLGMLGGIAVWYKDILPVSPQIALDLFRSGNFTGYDHPLYDHPAFLGYGLTVLAVIGLLFGQITNRSAKWLMICWFIVPIMLGHLSVIGWILLPDRFIAYMWFGVVLSAAVGLDRLRQLLPWPTVLWVGLALLLWGAQVSHTIVYIKDDIAGWSARFRPQAEFIEALQWLNTQPDAGTLVGIMAAANRELTFAPLWYDGPIASYPWYNLNHRNLKSFKANSHLYQGIFADPTKPEYLRVQAFYTIIAKPKSDEAHPLAVQYNLAYLIMPKGSQADDIWQQAQPAHFPQIYENAHYRIFSLR